MVGTIPSTLGSLSHLSGLCDSLRTFPSLLLSNFHSSFPLITIGGSTTTFSRARFPNRSTTSQNWINCTFHFLSLVLCESSSLFSLIPIFDSSLWNNSLNGTISDSLGQLTKLTLLYSYSCSSLIVLVLRLTPLGSNRYMDQNHFTGTIPASIGNLVNVTFLYLILSYSFLSLPPSPPYFL